MGDGLGGVPIEQAPDAGGTSAVGPAAALRLSRRSVLAGALSLVGVFSHQTD